MSEYLFEFSNTTEMKKYDGILGDAKKIERLLIQRPSFINGGGINLDKYKFEANTPTNLSAIEVEVASKVKQYLPDIIVNEIQVQKYDDTSILVGFNIGIDKPFVFGIILSDDANVVSRMIY